MMNRQTNKGPTGLPAPIEVGEGSMNMEPMQKETFPSEIDQFMADSHNSENDDEFNDDVRGKLEMVKNRSNEFLNSTTKMAPPEAILGTERVNYRKDKLIEEEEEGEEVVSHIPEESAVGRETCWICHCDIEDSSSDDDLDEEDFDDYRQPINIRGVCDCAGSMGTVHQVCIDNWVLGKRHTECGHCNARYCIESTYKVSNPDIPKYVLPQIICSLQHFYIPWVVAMSSSIAFALVRYMALPFLWGTLYRSHVGEEFFLGTNASSSSSNSTSTLIKLPEEGGVQEVPQENTTFTLFSTIEVAWFLSPEALSFFQTLCIGIIPLLFVKVSANNYTQWCQYFEKDEVDGIDNDLAGGIDEVVELGGGRHGPVAHPTTLAEAWKVADEEEAKAKAKADRKQKKLKKKKEQQVKKVEGEANKRIVTTLLSAPSTPRMSRSESLRSPSSRGPLVLPDFSSENVSGFDYSFDDQIEQVLSQPASPRLSRRGVSSLNMLPTLAGSHNSLPSLSDFGRVERKQSKLFELKQQALRAQGVEVKVAKVPMSVPSSPSGTRRNSLVFTTVPSGDNMNTLEGGDESAPASPTGSRRSLPAASPPSAADAGRLERRQSWWEMKNQAMKAQGVEVKVAKVPASVPSSPSGTRRGSFAFPTAVSGENIEKLEGAYYEGFASPAASVASTPTGSHRSLPLASPMMAPPPPLATGPFDGGIIGVGEQQQVPQALVDPEDDGEDPDLHNKPEGFTVVEQLMTIAKNTKLYVGLPTSSENRHRWAVEIIVSVICLSVLAVAGVMNIIVLVVAAAFVKRILRTTPPLTADQQTDRLAIAMGQRKGTSKDRIQQMFALYAFDVFFFSGILPVLMGLTTHYSFSGLATDCDWTQFHPTPLGLLSHWLLGAVILVALVRLESALMMPLFAPGIDFFVLRSIDLDAATNMWSWIHGQVMDLDPLKVLMDFCRVGFCELLSIIITVRAPFELYHYCVIPALNLLYYTEEELAAHAVSLAAATAANTTVNALNSAAASATSPTSSAGGEDVGHSLFDWIFSLLVLIWKLLVGGFDDGFEGEDAVVDPWTPIALPLSDPDHPVFHAVIAFTLLGTLLMYLTENPIRRQCLTVMRPPARVFSKLLRLDRYLFDEEKWDMVTAWLQENEGAVDLVLPPPPMEKMMVRRDRWLALEGYKPTLIRLRVLMFSFFFFCTVGLVAASFHIISIHLLREVVYTLPELIISGIVFPLCFFHPKKMVVSCLMFWLSVLYLAFFQPLAPVVETIYQWSCLSREEVCEQAYDLKYLLSRHITTQGTLREHEEQGGK